MCEYFAFCLTDMTHIETIWNMSLVDVLVGIHGSGLVNGIFMNERASMLEIIPVKAPGYATHKGTIMTWIYGRVPQRHAFFPLKPDEQKHELLRDWQKPFNLTWNRIEPFLSYLFDTPHDYVEPPPKPPSPKNVKVNNYVKHQTSTRSRNLDEFKNTGEFVPFSGKGYVLGSK